MIKVNVYDLTENDEVGIVPYKCDNAIPIIKEGFGGKEYPALELHLYGCVPKTVLFTNIFSIESC